MKRILGIDYGNKRIGIAVSDPMQIIASSIKFIPNNKHKYENIVRLMNDIDVELIIVGLPLNLKGERASKVKEVEEFVNNLKELTNLKIIEWDERYSTKIAKDTMIQMGLRKKQRMDKSKIDSMAAAIILQSYLDSIKHKSKNEN